MMKNGEINTKAGILEWFHFKDYQHVEKALALLKELNIQQLRTGFSWADYQREDGREWFDWLLPKLAREVEILPCFLYTPPSMGVEAKTAAPPRNPKDFADFMDHVIGRYGKFFEYVELWNEPNNRSEYDYTLDANWERFVEMITKASYWSQHLGKKTVLGGMSPFDPNWLSMMAKRGALEYIDVVGIHGFPHVFDEHWNGWAPKINKANQILRNHDLDCKIWITESGYSTWQHDYRKQVKAFADLLEAPVDRFYWYSLTDLASHYPTVDGFHLDNREYHFGLVDAHFRPKLLYRMLSEKESLLQGRDKWIYETPPSTGKNGSTKTKHFLITGGAGFLGSNLAGRLLDQGHEVTIVDNLSRRGVLRNARRLKKNYGDRVDLQVVDIRHPYQLDQLVAGKDAVFHFAAQVAVTKSFEDPMEDFEINIKGTLQLLEAIRRQENPPALLFTSTNKVFGALEDIELQENKTRYAPQTQRIKKAGVNGQRNLDFHSPYGCSKGAADQYVIDYARSFGIPAAVFRMSCIYGPHQYGNEDQGWVAHFAIQALKDKGLTIFGDGKQVRDILFVDDLLDAFLLAYEQIDQLSGQAFNIGGGPDNAISLLELISLLEQETGHKIPLEFEDWREGDQRYYVSDTTAFQKATGWKPQVAPNEGIQRLLNWLKVHVVPAAAYKKEFLEKEII